MPDDDGGMFTVVFWKRAAERAVKSAAQAIVAAVPMAAVFDFSVWEGALINAGLMAGLSIATSLASSRVGEGDDPSLVG